jgi:WD40 repeat protein
VKEWDGLVIPGNTVDFDFEHQRYVRSDPDGRLSIRSLQDDREQFALPGNGAPASWKLTFSPSGRYLVAGYTDYSCTIWNLESHQPVIVLTNFLLRGESFTPDEGLLALGEGAKPSGVTQTGTIHCYDLAKAKPSKLWSLDVPLLPYAVQFDPQGTMLGVCLSGEESVRLIDPRSGRVARELAAPINVNCLSWHPTGKRIAGAGGDGRIFLWDLDSTNPPTAFVAHQAAPVMNVQFSEDGDWLASAGWDRRFRLWDAATWEPILSTPLAITFFRQSRDGRWWGHEPGARRLGIWEVAGAREFRQLHNVAQPRAGVSRSSLSLGGQLLV